LEKMPNVTNIEKRVNIDMKNITVPRLVKDTTSEDQGGGGSHSNTCSCCCCAAVASRIQALHCTSQPTTMVCLVHWHSWGTPAWHVMSECLCLCSSSSSSSSSCGP
jgi:hypothetical protein